MTDGATGTHRLIGKAETLTKFPLIIGSDYNIPFLLNSPDKGFQVEGEVYAVDEKKLAVLDELEAHPHFYRRERHLVKFLDGDFALKQVEVWIYLLPNWREQLFNEATVMFKTYSSNGPHGRKYVDRYLRQQELDRQHCEINVLIRGTTSPNNGTA